MQPPELETDRGMLREDLRIHLKFGNLTHYASGAIFGLLFLLVTARVNQAYADDRIWFDATINGKPVRMVFDTGAEMTVLTRSAARRLGLKIFTPPAHETAAPGKLILPWTEPCDFKWSSMETRTSLFVLEFPKGVDLEGDGIFSWSSVRSNVLFLDWEAERIAFAGEPPPAPILDGWTHFHIKTNTKALILEFPESQGGPTRTLTIDTGSPSGISLTPDWWTRWSAQRSNEPATLDSFYQPVAGFCVSEVRWAQVFDLGPLTFNGVSVQPTTSSQLVVEQSMGALPSGATLGLATLKRLDAIFDGIRGVAYLRAKTNEPVPYPHNMLGAAFVPKDEKSKELVAHVARASPADHAGINNGDLLLAIDGRSVTKWRADSNAGLNTIFIDRRPGEKVELLLQRGRQKLKVTATLQNILGPAKPKGAL